MERDSREELPQINNLRLRDLAEHASIGVCITDPEGNDVLINERWCAMTGLALQDARNLGWLRSVHPEDRERVAREIERSRAEGTRYSMEHRFMRSDGTVTWVVLKAATVEDPLGRRSGFIAGMLTLASSPDIEENLARVTQLTGEAIRLKLGTTAARRDGTPAGEKGNQEISHLVRKEIDEARNMLCIRMIQESSLRLAEALETIFRLSLKEAKQG